MNMYAQPMQPSGMYGQPMQPYGMYCQPMQPSGMYSPLGQHRQLSPPPMGPAAVPAVPYTSAPFSQCLMEVVVSKQQPNTVRMMNLTWLDQHFYDRGSPTQTIGFRFSHALDPTRAAQSLQLAINEYPAVGSKVVMHNGKHYFQLDEERIVVQLVLVEPSTLKSMNQLSQIADIVCPKSADQKQNPLFHAFLFRCKDARHGSVLIAGFQHCIGDAGSYALFMQKWSQCYQKLSSFSPSPTPPPQIPPEPFRQMHLLDPNYKRITKGYEMPARTTGDKTRVDPSLDTVLNLFLFTESALKSLKQAAMAGCPKGEILSTNDILCAQCACALAPFRFKQARIADAQSLVRIALLIDFRGISLPLDTWGNRWSDITVVLPWAELLGGNALAIARKIRAEFEQQKELLKNDMARYYNQKRETQERTENIPRLFTWNSWAKAGDLLRTVTFKDEKVQGPQGQQELKWLNAAWYPTTEIVGVEPLAVSRESDPQIAIGVASPSADAGAEQAALRRVWPGAQVVEENTDAPPPRLFRPEY